MAFCGVVVLRKGSTFTSGKDAPAPPKQPIFALKLASDTYSASGCLPSPLVLDVRAALVEVRLAKGAFSVRSGKGRRGSAEARSRRASSEYGLLFATRVSGRFLPSLREDLCPEPVSRPGERQTKWATRFAEALLRRTTRNLAPEEETDGQVTRQWSGAVVRR